MRTQLGQFLQLVGMITLPLAIAAEIAGRATLGQSMVVALVGCGLFLYGTKIREAGE
jgi:hypothetical protein